MKLFEIFLVVFLTLFSAFVMLTPDESMSLIEVLKMLVDRANLTQGFYLVYSPATFSWVDACAIVHILLCAWWFYGITRADHRRVRRWEERQQRELNRRIRELFPRPNDAIPRVFNPNPATPTTSTPTTSTDDEARGQNPHPRGTAAPPNTPFRFPTRSPRRYSTETPPRYSSRSPPSTRHQRSAD